MAKNIVVCADGTGNKGGYTADSNVYKIYKAINKRSRGTAPDGFKFDEQIVFYDNGVGTDKNKYIRLMGASLGFGFEDNVCDLYKFLARNYELGDRIYFFGFSRGASTVRACSGFISTCGLAKGKGLRNRELDELVAEVFEAYKLHQKDPEQAEDARESKESYGVVPIYFMGVWDTVVALGFPKRTDRVGPLSSLINKFFLAAEKALDSIWPHSFYRYGLTDNIQLAYQALAIDDERTAFWPHIWREQGRKKGSVEQVWFSGMHSNVGGGYGRSGVASVALNWMMFRAERSGLKLEDSAVRQVVDDMHLHGRMYDSRDGAAMLYRYHPREIERLCEGRIKGNIKIHRSVIERINHRTANYAPGQLPATFDVVENSLHGKIIASRNPGKHPSWANVRNEINKSVLDRKRLFDVMLGFVLTFFLVAFLTWLPDSSIHEGILGHIADVFDYMLPEFFEGLVDLAVIQYPFILLLVAPLPVVYIKIRRHFHRNTIDACERLRHLVIHEKK